VIVDTAKQENAAFIVMGTQGRGALERFFIGSVADRVIRAAPCAVVTRRAAPVPT
jgi:nucleotide-binding universal stress UspA family protein